MKHRKTIADIHDRQSLECLFKSKVVTREDGCQIWSGSVGLSGYGQVSFEGRTWSAHRLAYEIAFGSIAQDVEKWWVLHKCDNPACCNPNHLYLGDAKDNANDMIDRKRQRMGFKRYGGGEDIRFGKVFYEIGGEIRTLHEWAEILAVNPSTLEQRISAGWPEKDLGLSSKVFKRHLKTDGQTHYRRFSGSEEVENYKSEAPVAVTTKASKSTILDGNIDMTSIAILEAVNTSHVPFNGQQIITAMAAGVAYVAMKPIVENLGMSWGTQQQKLMKSLEKFNCIHMNMVAADGKLRKLLCLPLKKLNGWLFSINPEKVRADIRDKLIQYQEECFTVLHDYWTKGEVKNPRKAKKALPGKITAEQQEAIKQLVMTRGKALPKECQAKAMITMWSSLKSHFGCSYKEISDDQFTEALSIAARVPLEGEFLGKQEALPAPKLDINFPISWFVENAPYTVIRQQCGDTIALDRSALVDCSPAYKLIAALTDAGYDVSAVSAELKALRTIMAEQSWAMKEIASYVAVRDKACHRISL